MALPPLLPPLTDKPITSTILPKKAVVEAPIATNDVAQQKLVADPAVTQFQAKANDNNNNMSTPSNLIFTGSSPINSASGADVLVENTNEHWVNTKWRPAMGWMYMVVCVTDFVIFPILWSILQAMYKGNVTEQWQPLTLQGAGLFHLAMGAVLGIAAYGRTKEKIENGKV